MTSTIVITPNILFITSTKQFCGVSNGSACTSYEYNPSYVLMAMGLDTNRVSSAIRISWGVKTDREDLVSNLTSLMEVAKGPFSCLPPKKIAFTGGNLYCFLLRISAPIP